MKRFATALIGLLCLCAAFSVHAEDLVQATGFPTVLDQFKEISATFGAKMVRVGGQLLFGLAGIQVAWNGIDMMLKGNFELKSVMANLLRTCIVTTFFFMVLTKSMTWFPYILGEWNRIGGAASGTGALDPGGLMYAGISLAEAMRAAAVAKMGNSFADMLRSFSISIQLVVVYVFVLLAFFVLSAQLALTMIKGYLWLCVGPLLLGFGGLKSTREIAVNTMKAAISIGVVIVTVYSIAGITLLAVPMWNSLIDQFTLDNWIPFWGIVVSSGLLALTAWQVPKVANDFINGSVSGGVSEVAGAGVTAAAGAAAAATGAGAVAGMAAGSGASSLGGVMQAINAGMAAAGDAGKSGVGQIASGLGHVASTAAGMAGGATMDLGKQVLDSIQSNSKDTIGGKIAARLEAERGGMISMSGASPNGSPNVGTGDATDATLGSPNGNGGGGVGQAGGASLASKIKGLNDYIPQGDAGVSVGGMGHGSASEAE